MKERPILFSAPMVRAILDGRKTQTRRVVRGSPTGPNSYVLGVHEGIWGIHEHPDAPTAFRARCPYGRPGDRLWVRETTVRVEEHGSKGPVFLASDNGQACVDGGLAPAPDDMTEVEPHEIKLRPAIHMPRSWTRILLEITDVRVERVQSISDENALAEGIHRVTVGSGYPDRFSALPSSWQDAIENPYSTHDSPSAAFGLLWEAINGRRGFGWNANPWVWALTFRRVEHDNAN